MSDYNRIIFVSKENLSKGPMAEWIFKSIIMDVSKEIESKGLVVLFPEPMNPKVYDLLRLHAVPCGQHISEEFSVSDVTEDTIVITMTSIEKIKIAEDLGLVENVYTINEFAEEESEIPDPYGGEEEDYEKCYLLMKEMLYQIKKKLNWN